MLRKVTFFGTLVGLVFLLGAISGAIAGEAAMDDLALFKGVQYSEGAKDSHVPHTAIADADNNHDMDGQVTPKTNQFQRIEQPPGNKMIVTVGGLGLIGLELWWFLLRKPKVRQASTKSGIQDVTISQI